jgi:lysine 2,3-aminomutase
MTHLPPSIHHLSQLVSHGLISGEQQAALEPVADRYAIAVTGQMLSLMDARDPFDPIARQFLPDAQELQHSPIELADPVGDEAFSPCAGIVHRYPDRALLKLVSICPVYCRFCFRREMVGPGKSEGLSEPQFRAAMDYLAKTPSIWEVVITGGDPLILSPRRLQKVVEALAAIPHIKVLRWHSRVPVVMPDHIDAALARSLAASGKSNWVAIHANHPREFTPAFAKACGILRDHGIGLLSQSVLLKGINDTTDLLVALMRGFIEHGIKPYYLHHPDLAPGTASFRLSLSEGKALVEALRGHVSGLLQPTYVIDIPGGHGKVPILSDAVTIIGEDQALLRDRHGVMHAYPPVAQASTRES